MKDQVRTIRLESTEETDVNPILHNIDLQRQLRQFIRENDAEVFIGRIEFSRRSCNVTFEALGDANPDAIVARHDPAHGADDPTPADPPADDPDASTREPDADPSTSTDDDPDTNAADATPSTDRGDIFAEAHKGSPPWTTDDDDDPHYELVDEEGVQIEQFATEDEAWSAFEKHDNAFDVRKVTATP